MKKKTEIVIEFDEVVVIKPDEHNVQECCPICGNRQALVTPSQASQILGVSVRTINRWVEADVVHFIETSSGSLLVCVGSIRLVGGQNLISNPGDIAPTSSAESGCDATTLSSANNDWTEN